MTKKKSFISLVLAFCMIIPTIFMLTACGANNNPAKLKSDDGIIVEGGNFEEGSVLETSEIDSESSDYKTTISLIASEDYDADKPVYIYEISVKKDNVKVQPNGKVKVSVPIDADLTGYDVLHIKDDGKIERLSVTYKNGIATFETDSFSKFVFVKKTTPTDSGNTGSEGTGNDGGAGSGGAGNTTGGTSGTGGDNANTTKYTIKPHADTIIPDSSDGGAVRDENGEYITNSTLELAEGSKCVLYSHCYPDYYFLGWYKATEGDEAVDDTFITSETTYTFTVTENIDILALYAYKTHAVRFTPVANNYGFSYRNGEPTTTLVSLNEDADKPNYKDAYILAELGDGSWKNYGSYSSPNSNLNVDLDNLDFTKVGTYTITYSHTRNSNIKTTLTVQVVDSAHTLSVTGDDN